ncbi:MAG: methyltransferase domain-containing protein [Planctomycetota bacterium]
MRREMIPELMDDPDVGRGDLDASLRFIRGVNRWLGGQRALIGCLRAWSRRWPSGSTVSLLDVATGSADLPIAAAEWARASGVQLAITGVDNHATTLELAQEQVDRANDTSIELERLNAGEITDRFGPNSFDYVHAGMFLHHLTELEAMTVLRKMDRVARRGVIWNDLSRSRLALLGAHVITAGQREIIRHDATVSVRKGFTRREALNMARRVGIDYARYRAMPLSQRFVVAGEKPEAW